MKRKEKKEHALGHWYNQYNKNELSEPNEEKIKEKVKMRKKAYKMQEGTFLELSSQNY